MCLTSLKSQLKRLSIRDTPNKEHDGLGSDFQTRVIMKTINSLKAF